jgi:WD40 repeat protein
VATASHDGKAILWDVETGRFLCIIEAHTRTVRSAAFNHTGDKVVTASHDGTARIWDVGPLLESERFLAEDCNLLQVALLNDIFEVMISRHYLEIHRKETPEKVAHLEGVVLVFDFNRYPSTVWDEYTNLPEAMRNLFDPCIIKLKTEEGISTGTD